MHANLFTVFHLRQLLICSADILGKLWAAPYTLLGLTYGLLAHVISKVLDGRPQIRLGNNAVQFIDSRGIAHRAALTLGNVILYGQGAEPWRCGAYGDACVNIGRHEQAHTWQYQLLGPLFVPVYLLGAISGARGNPFERAAQHFGAGGGNWWPWWDIS